MGPCWNCKSVVPLNVAKCLACDVLLTTDRSVLQSVQRTDPAGCLVCAVCGTTNSATNCAASCVACAATLVNAKVTLISCFAFLCVYSWY